LFLGAAYFPYTSNSEKETVLIHTLIGGLQKLHYQPQKMTNDFSQKAYDLYLERMDNGKRWLTQEDINMMEIYRNLLDDEAMAGTYEFFELSIQLLDKRIEQTQTYYRDLLAQPFDFTKDEQIELDGEKKAFAKDDAALQEQWRKNLKYEVLTRLEDKIKEQDKKKEEETDEEVSPKSMAELEEEARASVLELYDNWYNRIGKLKRTDRLSNYLNVLTNIYDPHTGYYEPIDKENFDIRMSGRLEGIGARLQSDGDFTKVSDIVVGGPAWKQKDLQKDDIIKKVRQTEGEWIDIKGMVLDDVVQQIRGDKGTTVFLTVESVDGEEKIIPIVRDVVIMEEGFAKSLILDGKTEDETIGYIYLPRFYADFNDRNGRFCATDVELEIEKLKAENVNGIILDLRNNGGGSLRDVVKMSGLFIEKGPIVQVESRGETPEILRDVNSDVQYDGPLVVMVNNYSASASEILAAALQDYGRAVIVGSTSTFGKGTVQRFFDLDRAVRHRPDVMPLGQVKLTTQKFYRINGGSTQLKGVTPDIVLPDSYQFITTGEREHEYPMEWTQIPAVSYSQNVYTIDNMKELRSNSNMRVQANEVFQKVNQNAKRLKEQRDESQYPLQLDAYMAYEKQQSDEAKKYKDMFEEVVNTGVRNIAADLPNIESDEGKQARNTDWIESVQKDIYIQETLHIMHDMLK
ncbi:MAG: carboxy terminal-processing peptidase, partial [Bacteroidota bacterium]